MFLKWTEWSSQKEKKTVEQNGAHCPAKKKKKNVNILPHNQKTKTRGGVIVMQISKQYDGKILQHKIYIKDKCNF